MPIKPHFKLSQSLSQLVIIIRVPHIRVSASTIEIDVDGSEFHFFSSPYLLHLSFPDRLIDDAENCKEAKASYDPYDQNGTLTVTIWKEEEKHWENLDLLSNLINRSGDATIKTIQNDKITIISSSDNDISNPNIENDSESQSEINMIACLKPRYGFLNSFHSVFTDYCREGLSHEMLEIPEPDEIPNEERREMRIQTENEKFDPERYLGDLLILDDIDQDEADMIYIEAIHMKPHWQKQLEHVCHDNTINVEYFNSDESLRLADVKATVPNIQCLNLSQTRSLLLSLVDILYAYAYDHRTTGGDQTCESSWTIVTLSPTLAWLESYTPPYDDIVQVLRWSMRRALTYPYLRNFEFICICVQDVGDILEAGRRVILRCLLHIQKIFDTSEYQYLFNKLYINPLICWIQKIDDDVVRVFSKEVYTIVKNEYLFAKHTLGLDLDSVEQRLLEEQDEVNEINDNSDDIGSVSSSSNESSAPNHSNSHDEDVQGLVISTKALYLEEQNGNDDIKSLENLVVSSASTIEDEIASKDVAEKKVLITEM